MKDWSGRPGSKRRRPTGKLGDGMMAGLVLQPSRSMTLGSKGDENLLKENLLKDLSKLEEKSGAAFLVSSDRSVILLGGRRAEQ